MQFIAFPGLRDQNLILLTNFRFDEVSQRSEVKLAEITLSM